MVIQSEITAGVLATDKTKAMAKAIFQQAVQDAGKSLTDIPTMIYLGIPTGLEEICLQAAEEIFGKDIPLCGGTTGYR